MAGRKYYSETRLNQILEELAQKIENTASSPAEAAQMVRAAGSSPSDVEANTPPPEVLRPRIGDL